MHVKLKVIAIKIVQIKVFAFKVIACAIMASMELTVVFKLTNKKTFLS